MSNNDQSRKVWKADGVCYHPSTTAKDVRILPGGVYRWVGTPVGWFLEMTGDKFQFPYKIYGQHDHIVDRLKRAWPVLDGNLGVLFDGIKGTGKTITAQLLANWCIEELNMPVLVVDSPVPLKDILDQLEQNVMVIFDEFEKTHHKKEDQQRILTCVDGMGRSQYRRFFLFTTNTPALEDNLVDRPSRIRYCWKFKRLSDSIIQMLMDDLLDQDCIQYRGDILQFLLTRNVCSIDVAKMVIREVNLFKESPVAFESIVNLTKRVPSSFKITVLDDENESRFSEYFKPNNYLEDLALILTKTGANQYMAGDSVWSRKIIHDKFSKKAIELVKPAEGDDPSIWMAYLSVNPDNTWIGDYPAVKKDLQNYAFFVDEVPEDWTVPRFAQALQDKKPWDNDEYDERDRFINGQTLHGGKKKLFRIQLEAQYHSYNWKSYGGSSFDM